MFGQVAEWLMAADCKSAAPWSYGGSNPPLSTSLEARSKRAVVNGSVVSGVERDLVSWIDGGANIE